MELLQFYSSLFEQLFNFQLPYWGITFGAMVVGVFGMPIIVHSFKKFF